MSLLDRLFGRKTGTEAPSAGAASTNSVPRLQPEPASQSASGKGDSRPYDTIGGALQAWEAGDASRAERLFQQGIDEYKRREPGGLDFALGRYGAFLLDQDRKDDAARILEL